MGDSHTQDALKARLQAAATGLLTLFFLLITATAALGYHGTIDDNEDTIVIEQPIVVNRPEPTFGGCYISTGKGLLNDLDCDKVPEPVDNCPTVPNPDQRDQTGNGLGDACDLYIAKLEPEPPVALQGRSLITRAELTNYRDYELRGLRIKAEIPSLGISTDDSIDRLKKLETTQEELIMRIPACARPGEHRLDLIIEYPYTAGKKEVFVKSTTIAVERSGNCPHEPTKNTIIDIIEIQDISPEDGGVYPFTITNKDSKAKTYVFNIEGTEPWGESQIEPRTLVLVGPGETHEGAVRIWAHEGYEGEKAFLLTVQAEGDIKQVQLTADIPEKDRTGLSTILYWTLGGLIIAATVTLIAMLIWRRQKVNTSQRA